MELPKRQPIFFFYIRDLGFRQSSGQYAFGFDGHERSARRAADRS
jgi:hypothetical protein